MERVQVFGDHGAGLEFIGGSRGVDFSRLVTFFSF
jgi:hypothetical protein